MMLADQRIRTSMHVMIARLMVATIRFLASVTPENAQRDKLGETGRFSAETLSLPSSPRK
jgi:hypothetical protein